MKLIVADSGSKSCHPERNGCSAKRSSHEVEGPRRCNGYQARGKAFRRCCRVLAEENSLKQSRLDGLARGPLDSLGAGSSTMLPSLRDSNFAQNDRVWSGYSC